MLVTIFVVAAVAVVAAGVAGGVAAVAVPASTTGGHCDEGSGGAGGVALSLVDLGEKKLRACFQEHREQVLHGENSLQVVVRFIETSKEVEDEGLVGDRFAEVRQRIHHGMKTTTVVGAGYVALKEGVELGGEVDGAKLGVAKELVLEVALDDARVRRWGQDFLEEVGGDGPREPSEHDTVHLRLVRMSGRIVREHVVRESILAVDHEKHAVPASFVPGGEVRCDGDQRLDVEDGNSLLVESGQGVGIDDRWRHRKDLRRRWRQSSGCRREGAELRQPWLPGLLQRG